jgi:4-hydroxybenzoate polyprenyltransferase
MRAGIIYQPRSIDGPQPCAIWSATGQEPRIDTTTSPTAAPARGQTARLVLYLGQMFPLSQMLPYAACHFFAFWFTLQALAGAPVVRVTGTAMRGVITVLLFLLLMRLYDELKDAATDLALGRSGDPLYRDRVLVTGAVRIEDIKLLRWVVTIALIALNIRLSVTYAAVAFWILFGVGWLSFHWFFWPRVSRHIVLAFVTHNPIALLLGAYVVALFADTFGPDLVDGRAALLLLGLWLPMAAWETSRKIRAPEDETTYQTYSRVLGWRTAALLPAVFSIASASVLAVVGRQAGLGPPFLVVIGGACAAVVWRCLLFRSAPSRRHAELKPWAMIYTTVANVGLVVAVLASRPELW